MTLHDRTVLVGRSLEEHHRWNHIWLNEKVDYLSKVVELQFFGIIVHGPDAFDDSLGDLLSEKHNVVCATKGNDRIQFVDQLNLVACVVDLRKENMWGQSAKYLQTVGLGHVVGLPDKIES